LIRAAEEWEDSWGREVEGRGRRHALQEGGLLVPRRGHSGQAPGVYGFVGGFDNYTRRCGEVVASNYEGLTFR
jgi:hypothetical protein